MKKIHTPISKSIGNQEIKTPSNEGYPSSSGAAEIFTPRSFNLSTKVGSFAAYVLNALPSSNEPFILFPLITTSLTDPFSTSSRN